jgi:hypothetical protein
MTHLSEEQLILHHYGESEEPREVADHLEACADCRDRYTRLQRTLGEADRLEVPWRGADYGEEVWKRLQPRLPEAPPRPKGWARRLVPIAAVAASLVVAFLLGRLSRDGELQPPRPIAGEARERILLVALGNHLEKSQMVLLELVNAPPGHTLNVDEQRQWAERLVPANRLYRQTAAATGETGVADVLADLERVLLEIAHGPASLSRDELAAFRERIESQGLLLKVKVIGSRTREGRGGVPLQPGTTTS